MAIKDLQAKQGKVDLEIEIFEKGEVRQFQKFGTAGRVCTAKGRDETGEISLTLWNDDIDKVNVGDKVKITNGYVGEWQGEKQLSTGKFGKLEIVGKSDGKEVPKKESKKPVKKEEPEEDLLEESDVEEDFVE